jgi:hypothetical protein
LSLRTLCAVRDVVFLRKPSGINSFRTLLQKPGGRYPPSQKRKMPGSPCKERGESPQSGAKPGATRIAREGTIYRAPTQARDDEARGGRLR